MDYLELANKANEYGLMNRVSNGYGQGILIACVAIVVILALGFIVCVYERDPFSLYILMGASLVVCFIFTFTKFTSANGDRLEELRKLAYDNNISSLENLIDNANYLSDKYDSKIDTFRIMYGDNMPSREDYINNILAEFYGGEPVNENFDYSTEYRELAKALR